MDFYRIKTRTTKTGLEVYPDFKVGRSKDLMVQAKSVYAIWDEGTGLWSTDEYDVQRLVDLDLSNFAREIEENTGVKPSVRYLGDFSSGSWRDFKTFVNHLSDANTPLDDKLTFSNTEVKKEDFVSKRLPYPLIEGDCEAYHELMSVLYAPEEKEKLEWAVGAVMAGEAVKIEKFLVLYGPPGAGKGTFLKVLLKLFQGYTATFDAKGLTSSSNAFSMDVFRKNPLVAVQHDGDLSKIEDNVKLNSIVSHEEMTMNEKFKPSYDTHVRAMLFMGTNKPVKITDAKSGIIRRLIDVHPSGERVTPRRYHTLMSQINMELGAIANHCLQVYRNLGRDYYEGYIPEEMMLQTDIFYNFIEAHYQLFRDQDGITVTQAWELYKTFITESGVEYKLPLYKFRTELANYFDEFHNRTVVDGIQVRSYYSGFKKDRFKLSKQEAKPLALVLDYDESLIDESYAECVAQLATPEEIPKRPWAQVTTTLSDIDTRALHYVKPPENHIVIDFDLRDAEGNKSQELNLEAANAWPPTYAEFSKGGGGVHLHYIYEGDVSMLAPVYDDGIEVKTFLGGSSLRRRLSKCNNTPVATLTVDLPQRERKPMLNQEAVKSEKVLRDLILRNLRKEIHPATKPSVDFIHKILEDAYHSDLTYDVSDLQPTLLAFAARSSNQALACMKTVQTMKFTSKSEITPGGDLDKPIVFFDVEVFVNLFIVCFKTRGSSEVSRMVNPTPNEIEQLVNSSNLVGFFNRGYDNHILYARLMGYSNDQLFALSQKLVGNGPGGKFGGAYNLSYADIYDFSSKKQSLKKFMIELGIYHLENELPWDEPVPEDRVMEVVEYCVNDVIATEATFEARIADFKAREILASLSGLTVNDTTQKHTAKIIFGDDKDFKDEFVYTDLTEMFPGYKFEGGKSTYRGEEIGEGGFVHSKPGFYRDVALIDVESMHPASIENLNLFGMYTERFSALKQVRVAIKNGDYESARGMLGGKLAPYLADEADAEALSYALKIVINIVYGLTSASFDNPFRDRRNKDNIVAKRGALFMVDLWRFVEDEGFEVIHIKTDSIKIPNATPSIIERIIEFGKEYGYNFVHEATYEKMALVNKAVYVAKYGWAEKSRLVGTWTAVGAQYQHPYVFKSLFSHEDIEFEDLCETKQVTKGAIWLNFADRFLHEPTSEKFIGRIGRFVPIKEGYGGGIMERRIEDKVYAVAGSSGYFWKEADVVQHINNGSDEINYEYFQDLVDEAIAAVEKYTPIDELIN